jgi:penicillin-insensitive murein endopeptidase
MNTTTSRCAFTSPRLRNDFHSSLGQIAGPYRWRRRSWVSAVLAAVLVSLAGGAHAASYCREAPTTSASMSYGAPSNGRVEGAEKFDDTEFARILPDRHRARCLFWGTKRLVRAIARAGESVARQLPGSPPLGVGNIGRARGGGISFSRSHHAGRDADLAFYFLDRAGKPVAATDLRIVDGRLSGLDVPRTWTLVAALLEDDSIEVQRLFVSRSIKQALLEEGRRRAVSESTLAKATRALHQPSDAPPHDDHLHLRIRCSAAEARVGCREG